MKPLHILSYSSISSANENEWAEEIPAAQRRRTPRIWRMALASVARLLKSTTHRPQSIIVASALGALDETREFFEGTIQTGSGTPRNFIASVHNSMAGRVALEMGAKGPNLTVCDGQNSLSSALQSAALLNKSDFPVLLLCIEENLNLLQTLAPHLSGKCHLNYSQASLDGACALLLGQSDISTVPTIAAYGPIPCQENNPVPAWEKLKLASAPGLTCVAAPSTSALPLLQPAFFIQSILTTKSQTESCIGCYCSTAHTASIIHLCI